MNRSERRRQAGGTRTRALVAVALLLAAAIFYRERFASRLVADDRSLPLEVTTRGGLEDRQAVNLACNRGDMRACRWLFAERFDAGRNVEAITLLSAIVERLAGVREGRDGRNEDLVDMREAAKALLATNHDGSELSPAQRATLGLDAAAALKANALAAEQRKTSRQGLDALVRSPPGAIPPQLRVEQYGYRLVVTNLGDHTLTVSILSYFPARNKAGELVAYEGCYWGIPDSTKGGTEEYVVFAPREARSLDFFADCGMARGRDPAAVPLNFGVFDEDTRLWVFMTRS